MFTEYNFNVGDSVAVINEGRLSSVQKVARVTKTQVVLDTGSKYRKDGSNLDKWSRYRIHPNVEHYVQERQNRLERRDLIDKINKVRLENLDTEVLKKLAAVLDEVTQPTIS